MKRYRVTRHEVFYQDYFIEAESPEAARKAVSDGFGRREECKPSFASCIDDEFWDVNEDLEDQ